MAKSNAGPTAVVLAICCYNSCDSKSHSAVMCFRPNSVNGERLCVPTNRSQMPTTADTMPTGVILGRIRLDRGWILVAAVHMEFPCPLPSLALLPDSPWTNTCKRAGVDLGDQLVARLTEK